MSNDIEKLAVFDDRIVQSRPKYAVEKGALSLTNSPFQAIAANPSQQTFQIQCPSQSVYIDRALDWTVVCCLSVQCVVSGTFNAGDIVLRFGRDCALASFPNHTLTQTLTATINDTTTTLNVADVLREITRLTDMGKNREQRTCPTYLDNYQNYNDADLNANSPLNGYGSAVNSENIPNGAYYDVAFTDSTGVDLSGNGSYIYNTVTYQYVNGVPVGTNDVSGNLITSYPLFFRYKSTEKLMLSPFIYSDVHEEETGLFGCQNIQLVMNMATPAMQGLSGRVLRNTTSGGRTLSNLSYNNGTSNQTQTPFKTATINVQFLTPSLDLPLPPKSIVQYAEYPRYITTVSQNIAPKTSANAVSSNTITLPQIPDLLIIYAKPQVYNPTEADYYLPIRKININFDNYSGLLSSHTPEELYSMSYKNGLHMDWNQWNGAGNLASVGNDVPLTGGFLVLKPSKDITLSTGQAPSLVGNFTFQFNCDIYNPTNNAVNGVNLWVITVNSGFFETVNGSSRIIKGVLNEKDIIDAPMASMATRGQLQRAVGGFSFKNMLGNALNKLPEIINIAKAFKGKGLDDASLVGASLAGAGGTGAGLAGAGVRSQKRKGLNARLL